MLHEIIASARSEVLPRFFLGRLYYRLEMHDEALRALAEIEERIESSPTYHYLLGRLREKSGDLHSALDAFKASLQEAGVTATEYSCAVCEARYESWSDRCSLCGSWGSIDLDFEEEGHGDPSGIVRPVVWEIDEGPL